MPHKSSDLRSTGIPIKEALMDGPEDAEIVIVHRQSVQNCPTL